MNTGMKGVEKMQINTLMITAAAILRTNGIRIWEHRKFAYHKYVLQQKKFRTRSGECPTGV